MESQPASDPSTARRAEFSTIGVFVDGKARLGHTNSWMRLCWDFEEARGYLFGLDVTFRPLYERLRRFKGAIKSQHRNMSRSSDGLAVVSPQLSSFELISHLPSRDIVDVLLRNYMETMNPILPLFDGTNLNDEMTKIWECPESADEDSLMQMFLILGMSCHSLLETEHGLRRDSLDARLVQLLGIGETMLNSRYRKTIRTLPELRALCIIVAARIMDIAPFHHTPDCVILIGVLVRAAQRMNLHRHPRNFAGIPQQEAHSRLLIWTLIVLLDGLVSVHSCLAPLICEDDYDAKFDLPPDAQTSTCEELNGSPVHNLNSSWCQEVFLGLMWCLLPTALKVLKRLNSIKPRFTLSEVEQFDTRMRHVLEKSQRLLSRNYTDAHTNLALPLQRALLEVLIRRTLIDLHQPFASLQGSSESQRSRLIVQECALALVVRHEELHENSLVKRQAAGLCDLLKEDLGVALIHVSLGIRRGDFDNSAIDNMDRSPNDIAWAALKTALKATQSQAARSVKHFQIYAGASCLGAALEALRSNEPIEKKMTEATHKIIQTMIQCGINEGAGSEGDAGDFDQGDEEHMGEDLFLLPGDQARAFLSSPCFFII
ncbi:hypothetical protein NM208_g4505 [Fusarium decemcellulare]|uniref:Uncharacterized protein n=1 Tax=Fusarium decemcellulare TaxID=57161 RepID=A0ACC1SKJ8_9HYPO|nr:hypothetical protein NM208_g4505 [Fusarium decemcellulare]